MHFGENDADPPVRGADITTPFNVQPGWRVMQTSESRTEMASRGAGVTAPSSGRISKSAGGLGSGEPPPMEVSYLRVTFSYTRANTGENGRLHKPELNAGYRSQKVQRK
jgi:hypothetical protein